MTRNKNRLFCRHFETVQHFQNFFAKLWFFIAIHVWCKFHCKIQLGKWFSTVGSLGTPPPLGTNGSKSIPCLILNVSMIIRTYSCSDATLLQNLYFYLTCLGTLFHLRRPSNHVTQEKLRKVKRYVWKSATASIRRRSDTTLWKKKRKKT